MSLSRIDGLLDVVYKYYFLTHLDELIRAGVFVCTKKSKKLVVILVVFTVLLSARAQKACLHHTD